VESTLEDVTKVAFKEYDYLFAYVPTASYLISEQALPGLRVANIVGETIGDAAMFRKDAVMLRNLIQKGLDSITEADFGRDGPIPQLQSGPGIVGGERAGTYQAGPKRNPLPTGAYGLEDAGNGRH
jgi:hypothetical protein